jgi:NADH-quinone oxidoreductase subunit G/[NiFe] hydrogenase diaphorase moiety small subunit/NADP-reducing hydrogenase subunit HndD
MEAALRTAYEVITGRDVPFKNLDIKPVRGMEGVRKATIKIENPLPEWSFLDGVELKCAVAHGLVNAKKVMDAVKDGTADFHFLEVMACPGGCLGGCGQPIPTNADIRKRRAAAIYAEDSDKPIRKSHKNPEVVKLYDDFLGTPNSEVSHKLLHTIYQVRERF